MSFEVITHGMRELEAAFTETTIKVDPVLGKALRELAKPVQQQAQSLALTQVTNMTQPWSRMRIGRKVTSVYVAEKERGSRIQWQARPNLNDLLMERALKPALAANEGKIHAGAALVIERLCQETEKEMFPV